MHDNEERVEGIVLHAFPFKEYDRILTLFTREKGMLKLYVKGSKQFSSLRNALTTPFTVGEYLLFPGKGELFRFGEGHVMSQNLRLRERLESLQVGAQLLDALFKSQWPDKPAPHIYDLLLLFLDKLPDAHTCEALSTSFLLKLLKHEGMFRLPPDMSREQEEILLFLAETRSLKKLLELPLPLELVKKVEVLFDQSI